LAGLPWNGHPLWRGIIIRFPMESLTGLLWNIQMISQMLCKGKLFLDKRAIGYVQYNTLVAEIQLVLVAEDLVIYDRVIIR
jgi:hypothetical protein